MSFDLFLSFDLSSVDSLTSFACGAMGGLCGKLASYPLEVVKKRQQVLGEEYLVGARLHFGRPHRERASAALALGHVAEGERGARPLQGPRACSPQGVARLGPHVRLVQPLPARAHQMILQLPTL